jgi:integrase
LENEKVNNRSVRRQGFWWKQPRTKPELLGLVLDRKTDGRRAKQTVAFDVPQQSIENQAVTDYIIGSLRKAVPRLISFALHNRSIFELAKYLYRHRSRSPKTLELYVFAIEKFCSWINKAPDQIVLECVTAQGYPDSGRLYDYGVLLDDWVGALQAKSLAPKTVSNYATAVQSLFIHNGLTLYYPYQLSTRIIYKDRAPTPEELQQLIDAGNLRDRVAISMLALAGFRLGTLCKLKYYHVMDDLESGVTPVHIHVESDITKGKYGDYDTFIGQEAIQYLNAYLDYRRHGSSSGKIPPEEITPESPLIRDLRSRRPKPITPQRLHYSIQRLMRQTGLLGVKRGSRYKLRPHSIRKFFRTQMTALGVDRDYIEYMMGHMVSTYHDIQMKGVEFLRNMYATAGLSIRPKTRVSKIEALKEIVRAWGMNPEEILTRKALSMRAATYIAPAQREEQEIRELRQALKEMLRKELLDER